MQTSDGRQSGSGYQLLESRWLQLADGRHCQVVVVAATLLPIQHGPLPKRYLVAYGCPSARLFGWDSNRIIGRYDDYAHARAAAESWIQGPRAEDVNHPR